MTPFAKKPASRNAPHATTATKAEAHTTLTLENAPMSDIIQALASARVNATALTEGYLARIEAYDRNGPKLNSVRAIDADAVKSASKLDTPNRLCNSRWRVSRFW